MTADELAAKVIEYGSSRWHTPNDWEGVRDDFSWASPYACWVVSQATGIPEGSLWESGLSEAILKEASLQILAPGTEPQVTEGGE